MQSTRVVNMHRLHALAVPALCGALALGLALGPGGISPGATDRAEQAASARQTPRGATGEAGLESIGRSDETGEAVNAVDAEEGYAYLIVGHKLWVVDISEPARPRKLGETLALPAMARRLDVQGDHAYLASPGSLWIIDVSKPASPRLVGEVDALGDAVDVQVSGPYAYVADRGGLLHVIDVTVPTEPRKILSLSLGDPSRSLRLMAMAVSGDSAYVVERFGELMVVDLSTPTAPRVRGSMTGDMFMRDVSVSGDHAYLVGSGPDADLLVIDVSNVDQPREVGRWRLGIGFEGLGSVVVEGGHAYVLGSSWPYLQVIDVSVPATPRKLTEVWAHTNADLHWQPVDVAGGLAFLAGWRPGLRVFDISAPGTPREVGVMGVWIGYLPALSCSR